MSRNGQRLSCELRTLAAGFYLVTAAANPSGRAAQRSGSRCLPSQRPCAVVGLANQAETLGAQESTRRRENVGEDGREERRGELRIMKKDGDMLGWKR